MEKASVAVLVSGGGTNLQAIIDAQKNGALVSGEVALVVSNNENAFALERAKNHGIKLRTVLKKNFATSAAFENAIVHELQAAQIDIVVLAGFMSILSGEFIKKFPDRIINIHPSLIPSFCGKGFYGLKVHEAALSYGVKITGATVHYVNEIPDGGKIILQKAVEVQEHDTAVVLQKRVMEEAEWKILPLALEEVCKKYLFAKNM